MDRFVFITLVTSLAILLVIILLRICLAFPTGLSEFYMDSADLSQVVPAEDIWDLAPTLRGSDMYRLSPAYLSDAVILPLLNNVLYGKDKQALHMNPLQSGRILRYSIRSIWMEKSTQQLVIDARVILYPELGVQPHADEWQLIFKVHHERPVEPLDVLKATMIPPPIPVDHLLPFAPSDLDTLSAPQPASFHTSLLYQ